LPLDEVLKNILGSLIKQVFVQMMQRRTDDERAIRLRPSRSAQRRREVIRDPHFFLIQADG
jgi:hypothetical protein